MKQFPEESPIHSEVFLPQRTKQTHNRQTHPPDRNRITNTVRLLLVSCYRIIMLINGWRVKVAPLRPTTARTPDPQVAANRIDEPHKTQDPL